MRFMQTENSCYRYLRCALLWIALLTTATSWSPAAEQITGTRGTPQHKAKVNFLQMARFGANSPLTNRPPKYTFPLLPHRTNETSGDISARKKLQPLRKWETASVRKA
jgi:hypothetical protein